MQEPSDCFICSGASGALEIAIKALLGPGDNMLVPCPGFSLYQTIAEGLGSSVKHYPLLPEKRWQVDVAAFDASFDENTKAVLLNNPSNPCGSVFPRE